MKKGWTLGVVSLCLIFFVASAWTQDVSKKKEIAVFNLSYTNWAIPNAILGSIDERIRSVFVNLGRFTVIGMTYRLGESDVNDFIDKIKQFKSENAVIPEQVQMGQEYFTQADMNRLIGSFIIVIPSVADFSSELTKNGETSIELKTSFTFVNVETTATIAQFFVDTQSTSKKYDDAVKSVVNQIPSRLGFEIRKIPEFQIKSGILEVHGSEVIFELGKDMGIVVGDEYDVLATRVLPSGKQVTEEKGLLLVRQVDQEISYATVLYADTPLEMGDQIREIPRVGTETALYTRIVVFNTEAVAPFIPATVVGLRQTLTRGIYALRPFLELEAPLHLMVYSTLPLNLSLGAEYNLFFGRFQLSPRLSIGIGFNIDTSEQTQVVYSRIGGSAGLGISLLVSRDFKIALEGGYTYWASPADPTLYGPAYSGIFAGASASLKF